MELANELKKIIKGDVLTDSETLKKFSRDASVFEVQPQIVVCPKDVEDVESLVRFVAEHKQDNPELSLTGRAGGTDMTGGPLSQSIVVSFTKYFNHVGSISEYQINTEPGVYYRDFEKVTLRQNLIMPSYPASREICAIGGMVNNNSGGEKSLIYGQTKNYVTGLKIVLADGKEHSFEALNQAQLEQKIAQQDFEAEIYRKASELIKNNYDLIQKARPKVSKNSSGYQIWDVWNKEKNIFDLSKIFVGSQGTLGLLTEARFRLVRVKKHSGMAVIFLDGIEKLGEVTNAILPLGPESFESYDDHTFKLALKYFPSFAKLLGARNIISLSWQFLPELKMVLTSGIPKLVLLVEFNEDDDTIVRDKLTQLESSLKPFDLKIRITKTPQEAQKYWVMRRESFNLLRNKIKNRQTAPFIDDFVVNPQKLPEFLPKLNEILNQYHLTYTIAGHVGNGNFHIIPLMNLANPEERKIIPELGEKVYNLILQYGGSITGEHNDGLIRSPYVQKMFGPEIYHLFEQIKHIFDPHNIFNPGKKVGSDLQFALEHIKHN